MVANSIYVQLTLQDWIDMSAGIILLCHVMARQSHDKLSIVNGNVVLKFSGPQVDATIAVSKAYSKRSLENFENSLKLFKKKTL